MVKEITPKNDQLIAFGIIYRDRKKYTLKDYFNQFCNEDKESTLEQIVLPCYSEE